MSDAGSDQEITMNQTVADPLPPSRGLPRKVDELTFQGSPEATLGVELELMVLDRETGDLASGRRGILKGCAEEATVRDFVSAELMQSMIEVKTGVCHNVREVAGRPVSRLEAGPQHRPLDGLRLGDVGHASLSSHVEQCRLSLGTLRPDLRPAGLHDPSAGGLRAARARRRSQRRHGDRRDQRARATPAAPAGRFPRIPRSGRGSTRGWRRAARPSSARCRTPGCRAIFRTGRTFARFSA